MTDIPPEPWDLHGHAYVGTWLLPRRLLPSPPSTTTVPVAIFGRGIVAAAFFVYEEPSPLTYHEVMATVLVRDGWRVRVAITHIWVDSVPSRDGGRALWAIPKELADFEVDAHLTYAAAGIGALAVRRVRLLPMRWPVAFCIAQHRDSVPVVSPVAGRLRPGLTTVSWSFVADGPLAFLSGRRPVLTLAARPFRLLFGRRGHRPTA